MEEGTQVRVSWTVSSKGTKGTLKLSGGTEGIGLTKLFTLGLLS